MPKKRDPDARPSEKLLRLYSMLLFSDRAFSLTEISETLNCSKPTVLRLISNLNASPHAKVVQSKHGKSSYYALSHPDKRPKVTLDSGGLDRLLLCRDFLQHLLPGEAREMVDGAIEHAAAYTLDDDNYKIYSGTGMPSSKGSVDYAPHQETLHTLIEAIRKQRLCRIEYRDSAPMIFAPKRLVYYRTIHLCGWEVDSEIEPERVKATPTTLYVHRITSAVMTKSSARKVPEPMELDAGYFGMEYEQKFVARIRLTGWAAEYVRERHWSSDQRIEDDGDGIIITMTATSPKEVRTWVLAFGDTAELLEPDWLREEVVEMLARMGALYGSTQIKQIR